MPSANVNYCNLLFLVLISAERHVLGIPVENRIIGGIEVDNAQHPYIVALIYPDTGLYFCAGSIIAPRTVLTAAHCIATGSGSNIVSENSVDLMTGTSDWNLPGVRHALESIHVHANFDYGRMDLDVAILITENVITYDSKTQPIALALVVPTLPAKVTTSGWGTTSATDFRPRMYHLRHAEVALVSDLNCKEDFQAYVDITDDMLCAGYGKDAMEPCSGHSGGPLVWYDKNNCNKAYLVGIVSFGMNCAQADFPGVYVKVSNAVITAFVNAQIKYR